MATPATSNDRWKQFHEAAAWKYFGFAMLALSFALVMALFSAAVASEGRTVLAALTGIGALGIAIWVGITVVPILARRSSLRWIVYQIEYKVTREGWIYIGGVLILVAAAMNTGNNLLFMVLGCAMAVILISGVLQHTVLAGLALKFEMPEHIFAEQPVLAEMDLHNDKHAWPSFSLRVVGFGEHESRPLLAQAVYFPYVPRQTTARQKVELRFAKRGIYKQDAFGIRTRFPFGFFEKTRRVDAKSEIVVYPAVGPTEQFCELLPLLSGEMSSHFRGRGVELHSLRDYEPTDSARSVDWKVTAKAGHLMVREYAREDERRVMLVLDPYVGPLGEAAESKVVMQFEQAVSLAACIAWHFNEIGSMLQFRTDRFATEFANAEEVVYSALRELAVIQPNPAAQGGLFLDDLAAQNDVFKIILTARPQRTIHTALWSSSYFVFIDRL